MSKGDIAKNYFENGYNCSQAVVLAFCEDFGLEKETAAMIAAPFGGGIGRLREVCGTFSGINMILGLAEEKALRKITAKKQNYTRMYKPWLKNSKQTTAQLYAEIYLTCV